MVDETTSIRTYREPDLLACRGLWAELTQRHRDLYDAQDIGGENPGEEFDEHLERVGADNIFIAEQNGLVVGLAGLIPGDSTELEPVIVTSEARGCGVGRALVATVFETATKRGIKRLVVRPVARNPSALRFFRDLGFRTLGQIELFAWLDGGDHWGVPGANVGDVEFKV